MVIKLTRMFSQKGVFVKDCFCECHEIYKHCGCDCNEKHLLTEDALHWQTSLDGKKGVKPRYPKGTLNKQGRTPGEQERFINYVEDFFIPSLEQKVESQTAYLEKSKPPFKITSCVKTISRSGRVSISLYLKEAENKCG